MYVAVLTSGTILFRYDYRINDRRETLAIGKYGQITLADAREKLLELEAKKLISQNISSSIEKQKKELGKTSHLGN